MQKGGFMAQRRDGVRNLLTSLTGKRFAPTLKSNHDYNLLIMSDSTSEAREQAQRHDWTSRQDAFSLVELQHFLMSEKRMLTPSATRKKKRPQSLRSRERRKSGSTNRGKLGSFTPLAFGTNGGMGADYNCFLKCLAEKLSEKNEEPYYITIQYNTIQYNSLLTLHWWGFSVTMRLKKKKLIKIREVVNNSIKRKECGEQSNINIPI